MNPIRSVTTNFGRGCRYLYPYVVLQGRFVGVSSSNFVASEPVHPSANERGLDEYRFDSAEVPASRSNSAVEPRLSTERRYWRGSSVERTKTTASPVTDITKLTAENVLNVSSWVIPATSLTIHQPLSLYHANSIPPVPTAIIM